MTDPNADAADEEPDWEELVAKMREARSKSRGYATAWEWAPDRSLAEMGVVQALADYLTSVEGTSWASITAVSDDPPDALLLSAYGRRIGVEVTEIVDQKMVQWHRHKKDIGTTYPYHWASWDRERLAQKVTSSVSLKDEKLTSRSSLYDEIFVIAYTDEPAIDLELARQTIPEVAVDVQTAHRAFFMLSYNPSADKQEFPQGTPVFEITLCKREQ